MTTKDAKQEKEEHARKQEELQHLLSRLSEDSEKVLEESAKWAPVFTFSRNYEENIQYPYAFPLFHASITLLCALTTHGATAKNLLALFDKMTPQDIFKSTFSMGGSYAWDAYAPKRYGASKVVFISDRVHEILASAAKEADEDNSPAIEPHHLLLAISSSFADKHALWHLQANGLTYKLLKQTFSSTGAISLGSVLPIQDRCRASESRACEDEQ